MNCIFIGNTTVSAYDIQVPQAKFEIFDKADYKLEQIKQFYNKGKLTKELFKELEPLKEGGKIIYADSASAQTIADFYDAGYNIDGATKGNGSVEYHEQLLRSFSRIVIDIDRCPHTKEEAEECVYKKDKNGDIQAGRYNIDPHSFDAMSYGLEEYEYIPLKERIRKKKYIGVNGGGKN